MNIRFQLGKYLGVQSLNHMVTLGLALSEVAKYDFQSSCNHQQRVRVVFFFFNLCCLQLELLVYFNLFFMFTETFFIATQTGKQLRCSSIGKKRYNIGYVWVMGCHSATKRNELLSHNETCAEPQMHITS